MSDFVEIPIRFRSDEKGYFDRECPNENCLFNFKVNMEDWENIFSNEVHCPMCGHIDESDQWFTESQLDEMRNIALNWAENYVSTELSKSFKALERSTRNNKYIQFKYSSKRVLSFANNPIGQSEEWELEIKCEKCNTRYSVIGNAYFCPCCGHNAVERVFDESLDIVRKEIASIPEMKELFANKFDNDKAEILCGQMLEGTLGEIISAFQKFAEVKYSSISTKKARSNDFQIVEKGSKLFKDAVQKGYDEWLSQGELDRMNCIFQRRHLFEHNNGIVDQRYLDKSGDNTYVIGQRLVVKTEEPLELLDIIEKLSNGLKTV